MVETPMTYSWKRLDLEWKENEKNPPKKFNEKNPRIVGDFFLCKKMKKFLIRKISNLFSERKTRTL